MSPAVHLLFTSYYMSYIRQSTRNDRPYNRTTSLKLKIFKKHYQTLNE